MPEEQWIRVVGEVDLKEGVPIFVKVNDKEVLLVRLDNRIHACGNKCTHYGAPLSDGYLSEHVVACPWHNARFDVTNGKMVAPPALDDLPVYPVKVENGEVYIGQAELSKIPKHSDQDKRIFLIIGAGAAGNMAAETLRREGFAGRILLLTAEPDRPYDRPILSKGYLAGTVPLEWIPLRSEEFYAEHHIELLTNHRVTALDPVDRNITLSNGKQLHFNQCLLATGGVPHRLNVPGSNLENFFLLRSLSDANALVTALEKARQVLVVGAGFIGLEVAASLRERGLEVHLVAPEKVILVNIFGERVGKRIQRLHEEKGIHFHLGMTLKEIVGTRKVQEAVLSDGSRLPVDVIVVGLGILPVVDYLQKTDLVQNGAVPVNGRLETRVEGIYAAGDIAVVPDSRTGEGRRIEHWVVAQCQGQHAARAMLGHVETYDQVPFFWTRQHSVSIKYVGLARQFDRIAYRGNVEKSDFLAGYYANGQLKAAAAIGMIKELFMMEEILKMGRSFSFDQFQDEAD